ncbi:DNA polymerase III subunit gamma/tau [Campylobacter sp. FMV-PI01]|uniref:DNA polymerase III subunit gamma/tau n=1 Tax=Campylobacter portucalensis TaxID=2608384 RepID=A0A6L5WHZ6_9BACT|nr:DNA polymerase III subunit gamma/tau [Campylobacter portucalensis]MSN95635.1 DNA polymerase III subunit gamma/tau [Campylobacter portucalensis]
MKQVLSLKYRPRKFSELIGQISVSKSLSYALDSNNLGHAYLFSGLRGSGKTSSARIFAKSMLCEKGISSNPCNECSSCLMANSSNHPDIIEIDAASHRKIDDIRDLIEQTKYAPSISKYKIFIIDEVHMLTKEASNAFLKTLEEPPYYVKFILATTDPLKLPATILSRTQHFRFRAISKNLVIEHLENILKKENVNYEKEALQIIARTGEGSLRDSITLLDQGISFSGGNLTSSAVANMLGLIDPARVEEILNLIIKGDREHLIEVIKELQNYDAQTILDEMISNLKEKFLNRDSKFSILMYERFFRILSGAKGFLSQGSDDGFTLMMSIFLMMEALNFRSIDDEIMKIKEQNESSKSIQNIISKPIYTEKKDEISPTYDMFLKNIYDRNYELGECFEKSVEFVDFKDNTLFLITHAKGKDQEILRKSSRAIIEVLKKTFRDDTKINISASKTQNNKINNELENFEKLNETTHQNIQNLKEKNSEIISQMISSNSFKLKSDEQKFNQFKKYFGEPKTSE